MVSYAERARKPQIAQSKPDPTPTSPSKQPVNVWNLRIEKMAAARAVSSSSSSSAVPQAKVAVAEPPAPQKAVPQDDPFVVSSPSEASLRPAPAAVPPPPIPDPENWPEVGKPVPQGHPHPPAPSDGSLSTSQSQPSTPSRRGEKTRWVPIPAEELQAAADAALKSRSASQSHSRHRSGHPRTNTTSSPLLNTAAALPHTRSPSGRTSANPSVAHSRVQSRAGSLQSSPRVPRTRRLPADEAGPSTASDATANYTLPPNSNPNSNYPAVPTQANGVYYPPPSTSSAIQSPPPPSFHTSTPAFYPQGALNGASSPLHHLTPPPPGIGSPLSPSSPSTHPYAYPPMPMYAPYDYSAPGPSYAHGLTPYAPWHGHEYPPPPRHHLSGHQSPIYPPPPHGPPPQHYALHGQVPEGPPQHPENVNGTSTSVVPPPALLGPSASTSSTASGLVFGSISLDARSPDALALHVPLPLSAVPSASSAGVNGEVKTGGEGGEGPSTEKEKPSTGVGKTFAIGVDASERGAGGVGAARVRAKAKAGGSTSTSEGANGKEDKEKEGVEVSSSPKKTRKAASSASASASTSASTQPSASASTPPSATARPEVKKWKFGTTSSDGSSVPATPSAGPYASLPPQTIASGVAGPSSLGLGHSAPPSIRMQHSATMPEISAAASMSPPMGAYSSSVSFVLPRRTPGSGSSAEGGEGSASASPPQAGPATTTTNYNNVPIPNTTPLPSTSPNTSTDASTTSTLLSTDPNAPSSDADFEVKDYGLSVGFGGYAAGVQVKEEEEGVVGLGRQEHQQRDMRHPGAGSDPWVGGHEEVGAGWGTGASGYGQRQGQGHQRQLSGYGYATPSVAGSGEEVPSVEGYPLSQGQEHHRQLSGYGYAGEEMPSVAVQLEGLTLSPGAHGTSRLEGEGVGAAPAYPPPPLHVHSLPSHTHTRGGPVDGMGVPPHSGSGSGRGRRGFRGYTSERGSGERAERGRRGGRGANGYNGRGFGSGRGFGGSGRGGPQRQGGPPPPQASSPFSVTPPPPHFQALPMLGPHEGQGQHYYPPPRQQQGPHSHSHYLPPPPNGYDYTSGAPSLPGSGLPPPPPSHLHPQQQLHQQHQAQPHQHQHMPIPPPLPAPGAPGAPGVLGFGGAPLPPPQSTIPFPLDSVRYWLLGQLEYYLSPQNMAMDFFLRQRMDARGWIPIPLLASFNRVKMLTLDTQLVRDVLSLSQLVQVRGSMVRMGGWERFVLPDAKPSTVEEQPLPLVYQAQNMGFWEEGGYRLPEGVEQLQGQGQGHQGQGQGQGEWAEGSATGQLGQEGHSQQPLAVNAVNGVTSPGAGGHASVNGGPPALNGVNKYGAEEDFEEEEEEEDVVFVMGEEAARGGSWSPDRRS